MGETEDNKRKPRLTKNEREIKLLLLLVSRPFEVFPLAFALGRIAVSNATVFNTATTPLKSIRSIRPWHQHKKRRT